MGKTKNEKYSNSLSYIIYIYLVNHIMLSIEKYTWERLKMKNNHFHYKALYNLPVIFI